MITLITGAPGSGKTLMAVAEFLLEAEQQGRHILVDGIPDLAVNHEPLPPVEQWTHEVPDAASQDGAKLLFNMQQGALVVIDEAQRVYRPRAVGSKVPPEVAAFETHRHQGLDFLLMTQHPGLIDSNVRNLVGRHLHIRDLGILGRKVYEWPEAGDVKRFRDAPVQRRYKLQKLAFDRYKSASLHVKPVRGIPRGLLLLALLVPVIIGMVWWIFHSIDKKTKKGKETPAQVVQASAVPVVVDISDSMLVEFSPRIPGRPESAPAYDQLRKVRNLPVVAGCVQTRLRCVCHYDNGQDADLDQTQCKSWLAHPPFDAYRERLASASTEKRNKAEVVAEQPNPEKMEKDNKAVHGGFGA